MMNFRQLVWAYSEFEIDPAEYHYDSVEDITAQLIPTSIGLNNTFELVEANTKQFTLEHIRQLVVGRGFLEVVCNWIKPEQIQDEQLKGRIALIQHLLSDTWEILNAH